MIIKKLQALKAKKGFTLVELLVVIAIIGILAAVLIPLMSSFLRGARISNAETTARTCATAIEFWLTSEILNRGRGINAGTAAAPTVENLTATIGGTPPAWTVTGVTAASWASQNVAATIAGILEESFPAADAPGSFLIRIQRSTPQNAWDSEGDVAVAFFPDIETPFADVLGVTAGVAMGAERFDGVNGGRRVAPGREVVGCFPPQ